MDFGSNIVVETAFGQSAGDSLPVLTRQTKGGIVMTKDDIRFIISALRYLLGHFNDKIQYKIYNPARCENEERCREICVDLCRIIAELERVCK